MQRHFTRVLRAGPLNLYVSYAIRGDETPDESSARLEAALCLDGMLRPEVPVLRPDGARIEGTLAEVTQTLATAGARGFMILLSQTGDLEGVSLR